jgi:hypothetical protein
MEAIIGVFTGEQLEELDTKTLEFIHQESAVHLDRVNGISGRIGDRSYTLLGIMVAVYSFLIAIASCFPSSHEPAITVMALGFAVSVRFVIKAASPFKSDLAGMEPKDMQKYIQWDTHDLYKEALLLSIYTNQNKINGNSGRNRMRTSFYKKGLYVWFVTCAIATLTLLIL